MLKNRLFTIILLCLFISACEEVIQLDLEEGKKRLVVEGRIERVIGKSKTKQIIKLSRTTGYIGNQKNPAAKGARVMVNDDLGNSFDFQESDSIDGIYFTRNLIPEYGRQYTLTINYENEKYTAVENFQKVPVIDTIYQFYQEENQFEDAGIRAKIDFTDPATVNNYYLWEQFADGESQIKPDPGNKGNILAKDKFFNGQKILGYTPNEEAILLPGETVLVRQISLSEIAYNYYFLIFEQTAFSDLFDPPPSTVRGNIRNLTNPENYALGFFMVNEVSEAELLIK